jgi:8-oxo-dGTP diphosphatase
MRLYSWGKDNTNNCKNKLGSIYLNDFPQTSAFDPRDQLLSIYYLVRTLGPLRVTAREQKFDFHGEEGDCQIFRWIPVACIEPHEFTFPIDQEVARRLKRDIESRMLLA